MKSDPRSDALAAKFVHSSAISSLKAPLACLQTYSAIAQRRPVNWNKGAANPFSPRPVPVFILYQPAVVIEFISADLSFTKSAFVTKVIKAGCHLGKTTRQINLNWRAACWACQGFKYPPIFIIHKPFTRHGMFLNLHHILRRYGQSRQLPFAPARLLHKVSGTCSHHLHRPDHLYCDQSASVPLLLHLGWFLLISLIHFPAQDAVDIPQWQDRHSEVP